MVCSLNAPSRPSTPSGRYASIVTSLALAACIALVSSPTLWAQPVELETVGASGRAAADLVDEPLSAEELAVTRAELSASLAQIAGQRFPYLRWEADPDSQQGSALIAEIFRRDHAVCGTELRLRLLVLQGASPREIDGVGAVILGTLCDPTFAIDGETLARQAAEAVAELLSQEAVQKELSAGFLSNVAFLQHLEVTEDGDIRLPVDRETIASGDGSLVRVEFQAPLPTTGERQTGLARLRTALPGDSSIQCQVLEFLFPDFIVMHRNAEGPFRDQRFARALRQESVEGLRLFMEDHDLLTGSVPLSGGPITSGP
ncbi:MAG: hypothetical protein AAGD01_09025 [Acidobacteriota bacterium]